MVAAVLAFFGVTVTFFAFFDRSSSMKAISVFLLLMLTAAVWGVPRVSLGLGPEINLNSGTAFDLGAVLSLDVSFADYWGVGVVAKGSHDFSSAWVVEGAAFGRRYFSGAAPRQGSTYSGFFAQAEAGIHIIVEDNVHLEVGESLTRVMGGLRAGYRFLLGSSRGFYLEPYARGGYPYLWGVGVIAGMRLGTGDFTVTVTD